MNAKQFLLVLLGFTLPFIIIFGTFLVFFSFINPPKAIVDDTHYNVENTHNNEKLIKKELYTVSYEDEELLDTEISELIKYVCKVETDQGIQGSGVLISDNGYIITNYHVVEKGNISVTFQDEKGNESDLKPAKLITYNADDDIALLHVDDLMKDGFIMFAPEDSIKLGEKVVAIGSSKGLINTLSFGNVTGLRDEYIQTDAAVSPGNSGGALLNQKGQLIGITTSKVIGGENLNFALSIGVIMDFLDEIDINSINLYGNEDENSQTPEESNSSIQSYETDKYIGDPIHCDFTVNYLGGIELYWEVKNNTNKRIKYYTVYGEMYNRVDDPAYDEITRKSQFAVKYIGPVETTGSLLVFSNVAYCEVCYKIIITNVMVEYFDGTSENFTCNHVAYRVNRHNFNFAF